MLRREQTSSTVLCVLVVALSACVIDVQLDATTGETETDTSPADDCPDPGFADLTPAEPAFEYVRRLVCAGVIDPPTADRPNFDSQLGITRAEYLKFHLELAFPDVDFTTVHDPLEYLDVDSNAWYAPYVAFATAQGIVEGYAGDLFRPEQTTNRAEAAEIAVNVGASTDVAARERYRQLHAEYLELIAGDEVSDLFDDVDWDTLGCAEDLGYDDGCWFYYPVHALHRFDGAVCGVGDNRFEPGTGLHRDEAARIACIVSGLCPGEVCP